MVEAQEADLLLLVADATDKNLSKEIAVVRSILKDIEADKSDQILVLNKVDLLDEQELQMLKALYPEAVFISAQKGTGINGLLHKIQEIASAGDKVISALIPFNKGALVKSVHERCQLLHEQYVAEGLLLSVKADTYMQALLQPYVVSEDDILTDE